jgi:hypothetical protein
MGTKSASFFGFEKQFDITITEGINLRLKYDMDGTVFVSALCAKND